MNNTTKTNLKNAIALVTDEQIAKCARTYNPDGTAWYQVENEAGEIGDDNEVITYKTAFTAEKGFTCTCKSGLEGFAHCGKTGYCKHVVWSLAAAREFRATEIGAIETLFKH